MQGAVRFTCCGAPTHLRLEEKKYAAGQIDARWTAAIEDDYRAWLKQNEDHLSVSKNRVEEILKDHEQGIAPVGWQRFRARSKMTTTAGFLKETISR